MLKTVLVILTLGEGGATHLSLSAAEDARDCAARGERLAGVLTQAGYQVLGQGCAQTGLEVTPYVPGADAQAFVNRWRVTLSDPAMIEPLAPDAACMPAPDADPAVFCAVSAQQVVD
ncbi:MAG TPA: hypothetical protein PLL33_05010 [Paracoccus sp. (in: a-proteobacteria)]|nr:hypothetical protein [Paracoccus sp. (in: a-proteobacteria)]